MAADDRFDIVIFFKQLGLWRPNKHDTKRAYQGIRPVQCLGEREGLGLAGSPPSDLLWQDVPSSFSSINDTLRHIWESQLFYLSVLQQSEVNHNGNSSFEEVARGLLDSSDALIHFVDDLGQQDINDLRCVNRPGVRAERPISEFCLQCINHGTYHRGQIVTMGHQLGLSKAPATDYYRFLLS